MRTRIFCFLISLLITKVTTSQKSYPRFRTTTSIGLAAGEKSNALVLETVNGVRFSNWLAALGIGIDDYRYITLPLFAHGKYFFDTLNRAFFYANVGYNFPLKNKPGSEMGYYNDYSFSGGLYAGAGIGYAFPLGRRSAVVFSAGYSYKELMSKTAIRICPFVPPCYEEKYQYELNYGRIVLKVGFSF